MLSARSGDRWTAQIVREPAIRDRELKKAIVIEVLCSIGALACALIAVWGFTDGTRVFDSIGGTAAGGLATLCFTAFMAMAAGGGIRRRLITLVGELESAGLRR